MRLLAIDPGTTQSAWVIWDGSDAHSDIVDNEQMLRIVQSPVVQIGANAAGLTHLVVEMVESFGMPVGKEVFETVFWIGRFCQAWGSKPWERLSRMKVKMHLCHSARAKDANIRQALLDRFGPQGTKKAPGKLYGVRSHEWSALALAVTFADSLEVPHAYRWGSPGAVQGQDGRGVMETFKKCNKAGKAYTCKFCRAEVWYHRIEGCYFDVGGERKHTCERKSEHYKAEAFQRNQFARDARRATNDRS